MIIKNIKSGYFLYSYSNGAVWTKEINLAIKIWVVRNHLPMLRSLILDYGLNNLKFIHGDDFKSELSYLFA
jgi:hypothetical protein